jgi:hypothetical protein
LLATLNVVPARSDVFSSIKGIPLREFLCLGLLAMIRFAHSSTDGELMFSVVVRRRALRIFCMRDLMRIGRSPGSDLCGITRTSLVRARGDRPSAGSNCFPEITPSPIRTSRTGAPVSLSGPGTHWGTHTQHGSARFDARRCDEPIFGFAPLEFGCHGCKLLLVNSLRLSVPSSKWRRREDLNPRDLAACRFSKPVHSATLPRLRSGGRV